MPENEEYNSAFTGEEIDEAVSDVQAYKQSWDGKYAKPPDGIPKSDLNSAVQDAIDRANSALQSESDPTVPSWAKTPAKPSYTAEEVGADPAGTAASEVSAHNTSSSAHNDLRLLISGLADRLNAIADSDDTTLDQLSEIVTYIKANRDLISSVTTSKVSVSDIVNNLTTPVTNKPLSAAQGVALAALIAAKSDFSGDYNDLDNQPAIPATASDVGADPAGTAASAVSSHVDSDSAHSDLFAAKQNVPITATSFPPSGSALADNTVYTVSTNVAARQFVAPSSGWAHGTFTKGSSGNITFGAGAEFLGGETPTFESGKRYEFDVLNGVWAFAEVSS